jgi:hypothetical protein
MSPRATGSPCAFVISAIRPGSFAVARNSDPGIGDTTPLTRIVALTVPSRAG